jgi:hypothetical protein
MFFFQLFFFYYHKYKLNKRMKKHFLEFDKDYLTIHNSENK